MNCVICICISKVDRYIFVIIRSSVVIGRLSFGGSESLPYPFWKLVFMTALIWTSFPDRRSQNGRASFKWMRNGENPHFGRILVKRSTLCISSFFIFSIVGHVANVLAKFVLTIYLFYLVCCNCRHCSVGVILQIRIFSVKLEKTRKCLKKKSGVFFLSS